MASIYDSLGAPTTANLAGGPAAIQATTPAVAAGAGLSSSTTMAISSGVGTGIQIVGQIHSAIQAAKMGEYNAGVAKANAQAQAHQLQTTAYQHDRLAEIAQYDIALSQEAAQFREAQLRAQSERIQGVTEARIGASGVGFSGSPLAVLDANARQAEMAVMVSNYQASLEQYALREEQRQQRYGAVLARYGAGERLRLGEQQSDLSRYESGNAAAASILGATGSAITGYQRFENARTGGTYGTGRKGTLFDGSD